MLCEKDKEDRRRRSWSELVLPPSRVRYKCSVLLILAFYVFILMMRPGVEPKYLLKLDTHKHTILTLCPYKTVLVLTHFILIYNALISPCHRGQVNGRLDTRFEWDFIFLCEFT